MGFQRRDKFISFHPTYFLAAERIDRYTPSFFKGQTCHTRMWKYLKLEIPVNWYLVSIETFWKWAVRHNPMLLSIILKGDLQDLNQIVSFQFQIRNSFFWILPKPRDVFFFEQTSKLVYLHFRKKKKTSRSIPSLFYKNLTSTHFQYFWNDMSHQSFIMRHVSFHGYQHSSVFFKFTNHI